MVEVLFPSSQGAAEHFIAFSSVTLEILPPLPMVRITLMTVEYLLGGENVKIH